MFAMLVMLAKATKTSATTPTKTPPICAIQMVGSLLPRATAASRPTISPSTAAPKMPIRFGQVATRSLRVSRARLPR